MARNIVLIGSDSIRADHCSCYGYSRETTPFIDSLAERGVKFENPIVSGLATTNSFLGIFTGEHYSIEYNLVDPKPWKSAIDQRKTLAQVLSRNGYNTYGLNTNALLSRYYGFNKGFQHYYDGFWATEGEHTLWWKAKRFYLLPLLKKVGLAQHAMNLKNMLTGKAGFPRAEEWLDDIFNTRLEEPYFLWIFLVDTHLPYIPPEEYARWGKTGKRRMIWLNHRMRRQGKWEMASKGDRWAMAQQKLQPKLSQKERETIVNAYDGEILHVDSIVKRLWEHLKDSDPIFIFHSDHGDEFGEHGFYGHPPEHYEGLIRVPLIVYNAGQKGVVEEPVSLLRLAPTICELAGMENEFEHPSLLGEVPYSPTIVENIIGEGLRVTVRDREWKLITNPDGEDELYNIKEDPLEQEKLIGEEKVVEKELRRRIEDHKKKRMEKDRLREKIMGLRRLNP